MSYALSGIAASISRRAVAQELQRLALLIEYRLGLSAFVDHRLQLDGLRVIGRTERHDLRLHGLPLAFQFALPSGELIVPRAPLDEVARLLQRARCAHQHPSRSGVDIPEFRAMVRQGEFADLVGMGHPAGFQDIQPAGAFSVVFQIPYQQPGIHERGDADFGGFWIVRFGGQTREDGRDLMALQKVDEPGQHRLRLRCRPDVHQIRHGIEHDRPGLKVRDLPMDSGEMHFEAPQMRARRVIPQEAPLHPLTEVEPDRPHVAENLLL